MNTPIATTPVGGSLKPVGSEWDEYVRLLLSMATDTLMGCGPSTKQTFVMNLRIIADNMEKLILNNQAEP